MKYSFRFGLAALSVLLISTETRSAQEHSSKFILRNYSLEQLDSAANLLVGAADQETQARNVLYCKISSAEALRLLQPLHALMDQKIDLFLKKTSRLNQISKPNWMRNCRKTCHCGLYASILEKGEELRLAPLDQKALSYFQNQALQASTSEINTCIRKAVWFCRSSLLDYLRDP